MLNHDAYSSYHAVNLDAQTARASPVELVLVLTDGLLEELARARGHIVGRRFEQKALSLDKCVEIINGLSSSLDFEQGGEVVLNLARLYDYCAARLYTAGVELNPAVIDEVTALLALARQLDAAAAADNWTTLAAVNRAMAESLTRLSAQGPWNAQEKAALLVLRAAHGNAYQHTSQAKDKLGIQLSDMQANKEGWIAYAMHGSDPDGNPA